MTTLILPSQPSFLTKKIFPGVTAATVLIIAITAFSLGLHLYNIQSIGNANAYYTAAVKSMLQSWSNFFFVAAEPGGSVSVDKPPLGLWIETVFAYFLGVSGFSVSLPNILAGVFSVPVLYLLIKKYAGELAGLIAAFVMTTTPVFLATNRNNTMDGMLVFTLLVAAWAFIHAAEAGRLRWVLLGAFIIGLGFNIKMSQALLPLPAFYALYFLGSKEGWIRKVINLGAATVLLVVVSLSWAIAVDLIPADSRPYVGSSKDNRVISLMLEHNGISRLENTGGPGGGGPQNGTRQGPPPEALAVCVHLSQGVQCSFQGRDRTVNGTCIMPPNLNQLACAPQGMIPQQQNGQGGTPFSRETGEPGFLRFFTAPLSKQMSWLLPFALISLVFIPFAARLRLPLESDAHKAFVIWGGWLLTCVVFFSMVSGIFHAYYAIMLAPPLGAVIGVGFAQLWSWKNKTWAGVVLIISAVITFGFQVFASYQYDVRSAWMLAAGLVLATGILLAGGKKRAGYFIILAAMLIIPAYWTVKTVTSAGDINLPTAYQGNKDRQNMPHPPSNVNEKLIAYLQANTQGMEYIAAVPSAHQGAQIVLATGRPVLYMGGFNGQDDVVNVDDLKTMVADGRLRYIMYGGDRNNKDDIAEWLARSCSIIPEFSQINDLPPVNPTQPGPRDEVTRLYACR